MDYDLVLRKLKALQNEVESLKTQERASGGVAATIDGISNVGGDIDLTVTGSGLTITPNDTTNVINFDVSALATDADLASHTSNTSNPHAVTAAQAGALVSVAGVSNAGGNIALNVTGSGLTITPNDTTNTIDFNVSALATDAELATHTSNTSNPHAVTAAQVSAVALSPGAAQTANASVTNSSGNTLAVAATSSGVALAASSVTGNTINATSSGAGNALNASSSSGYGIVADKVNVTSYIAFGGVRRWEFVNTSMPSSPATGQICNRTDLLYSEWVYDGSAWQQLAVPSKTTNFTMTGTPPTNMRVFRTDRGREYFYDGTRWLSSTEFTINFAPRAAQPFPQAQQLFDGPWVRPAVLENGVYILDYNGVFIANSVAQSAINYYTITIYAQKLATQSTLTITGVANSQSATATNTRYYFDGSMNFYADSSYVRSVIAFDVNNNPGTFSIALNLRYRLVG